MKHFDILVTMSMGRDKMNQTLRELVLPELRKKGFKGSLPYLRRTKDGLIDLIAFEYSMGGRRFYVSIGKYPVTGLTMRHGQKVPAKNIRHYNLDLDKRPRLTPLTKSDPWFNFNNGNPNDYKRCAKEVLDAINTKAEKWWADKKNISIGAPLSANV